MVTPVDFMFLLYDPNFQLGYELGYEAAKREMANTLKDMKPFFEDSGTVGIEIGKAE